ncbi:SLAM family member 5-like, partial [Sylvia atricapilla]|uniref:SLAM family member 5-like n=1 Tax=Sylvia atricapilla TaxID=48155 RepID=UPI0033917DE5
MEGFWIQLLAILTLLTQTCSASDNTEIRAVGGAVTFRIDNTEGNGARWSVGDDPIVAVESGDSPRFKFSKEEYKTRFTVSEDGRTLSITQLRMEDAGNYSVNINGKKSTFTLLVYRELPEPTVTCAAQDCLGSTCLFSLCCSVPGDGFGDISYTWTGWGLRWGEKSAVLALVNESFWDNLEPLRCTAWNAVSIRSVTVINPEELCP